MSPRILALFSSPARARAAVSALIDAGVPASAIAIAEVRPGVGVVFGSASTTVPGEDDPFAWPGPYGNILGPVISGAFNPSIVQTFNPDDLTASFLDFGLSEPEAAACARALAHGATFLAIDTENNPTPPESIHQILRTHDAFSPAGL